MVASMRLFCLLIMALALHSLAVAAQPFKAASSVEPLKRQAARPEQPLSQPRPPARGPVLPFSRDVLLQETQRVWQQSEVRAAVDQAVARVFTARGRQALQALATRTAARTGRRDRDRERIVRSNAAVSGGADMWSGSGSGSGSGIAIGAGLGAWQTTRTRIGARARAGESPLADIDRQLAPVVKSRHMVLGGSYLRKDGKPLGGTIVGPFLGVRTSTIPWLLRHEAPGEPVTGAPEPLVYQPVYRFIPDPNTDAQTKKWNPMNLFKDSEGFEFTQSTASGKDFTVHGTQRKPALNAMLDPKLFQTMAPEPPSFIRPPVPRPGFHPFQSSGRGDPAVANKPAVDQPGQDKPTGTTFIETAALAVPAAYDINYQTPTYVSTFLPASEEIIPRFQQISSTAAGQLSPRPVLATSTPFDPWGYYHFSGGTGAARVPDVPVMAPRGSPSPSDPAQSQLLQQLGTPAYLAQPQ